MSSTGVEKRGSASTVRACDLCRKRKRKCVWASGTGSSTACVNCSRLEETCTTTYVRKPRTRPQRVNRIAEYERRIQSLESLLQEREAAQPQIQNRPLLQLTESSVPISTWVDNLRHEVETMPRPEAPDFDPFDYTAEAPVLPFNEVIVAPSTNDPTQLNPTTTTFLAPTLGDLQPSADFQEDAAFLQSTVFEPESIVATSTDLPPPLPIQPACDWYLPPPDLGTSLLAEYLTDFNTAFPLYQPHVIADHLRFCYAGNIGASVEWISAYVVFGLAHLHRAMSATGTENDNEMARFYLARIYLALNGLLVSPPSLGLVQCLIGVAFLIRATPSTYTMSEGHFLSTALCVVRCLAYQDDDAYASETARDVEQERRVFWLAFIQDTNASILTNSPTTHRHEDIIACQPEFSDDSLGAVTAAEGSWKVNIFALRVSLALLQAEAIDQVLSVGTRNKTPTAIDAATASILTRLQAFHDHEIFQLSASQLFRLLYRSDISHTVHLEASYFATVFRLHAFMTFDKNAKMHPFSLQGLDKLAEVQDQKCYTEAKKLLSLLPVAPRGDVGLYWALHRVIVAALVTVFAHHINNPTAEALSLAEIRAYNQVLSDIGIMVRNSGNADVAQMRDLCMKLFSKLQPGLRTHNGSRVSLNMIADISRVR